MEPAVAIEPIAQCIDKETLLDFGSGRLPDSLQAAIVTHISGCANCQTIVEKHLSELPSGPFSDRLRQCLTHASASTDLPRVVTESAATVLARQEPRNASSTLLEEFGRAVGSYTLLEVVGQGGMGVVFRARKQGEEHSVALKMIRIGALATGEAIGRLRTEAQAIARLDHPNVVRLLEVAEHNGLPYYVMEWVAGGSLKARLEAGTLALRDAAELVRILAGAVAFAHEMQVLHRDLKPSNVLLTLDGAPKIADFGLAKLLDRHGDLTNSAAQLGTPSYMAPEQAAGKAKAIGPRTDVYALGAILYEALTGQPPYRGDDKFEVMRLVRDEPLTHPARWREVPAYLRAICLKCLEKSPAERYASAQALADDLGRWLNNERPQAVPGRLRRAIRVARRRKLALVAVAAAIAFAVLLNLRDPDRPLREIQSELAHGRPVTLIGETGMPSWFRFISGEDSTKTTLSREKCFTIHAADACFLELAPGVSSGNYRYSMQVRHEKSSRPGFVGIYFAEQLTQEGESKIHFSQQLTFNDVVDKREWPLGDKFKQRARNIVEMRSVLYIMEGADFRGGCSMSGAVGPDFEVAGGSKSTWHEFAVVVSPSGVTAEWDGQKFHLNRDRIANHIATTIANYRTDHPNKLLLQKTEVQYLPTGGVGLVLVRGSASFRSAVVTPLQAPFHPVAEGK